jgi:Condensation domain
MRASEVPERAPPSPAASWRPGAEIAPTPARRAQTERVPLTLTQLLQWHCMKTGERPCQRATASAVRVRGPLSLEALRHSVKMMVLWHEALRTNIVIECGVPTQRVADSAENYLQERDLRTLSKDLASEEARRQIVEVIRQPVDPARDPLFLMTVFRLENDDHILLLAMEHIISDACSLNILWRDLFSTYFLTLQGRPGEPPEIAIQYADYAVWQAKAYRAWLQRHGARWNARMKNCASARFPVDTGVEPTPACGWATVPLHIDPALRAEWRDSCRRRRTTLPISAFATYVALVLRWCDSPEAVFQYQTNGRATALVQNTVGLFASVLYLHMGLNETDTFVNLVNRATEEYCRSYGSGQFCSIAAQIPRPEFSRNSAFNWVPSRPGPNMTQTGGAAGSLRVEDLPFVNPVLEGLAMDADPSITFVDDEDRVTGSLVFPLRRFSPNTMERFAQHFLILLKALLREPEGRVKDVPLE